VRGLSKKCSVNVMKNKTRTMLNDKESEETLQRESMLNHESIVLGDKYSNRLHVVKRDILR